MRSRMAMPAFAQRMADRGAPSSANATAVSSWLRASATLAGGVFFGLFILICLTMGSSVGDAGGEDCGSQPVHAPPRVQTVLHRDRGREVNGRRGEVDADPHRR